MLNNVDNLEQCWQQNIVQCCFHQARTGCSFFAVYCRSLCALCSKIKDLRQGYKECILLSVPNCALIFNTTSSNEFLMSFKQLKQVVYATKFHPDVFSAQCRNGLVTSFTEFHCLASFVRNLALNNMQISYL